MFLLDANVLLYAFLQRSPHHAACERWLRTALAGDEPVATSSVVELALVRISTLPALGKAAATPKDAFSFLAALRRQPTAVRIDPGPEHHGILERLCDKLGLRGNDVNDAWLAALAIEHGATMVTVDRGFARFSGLPVVDPTATGDTRI